MLLTHPPLIGHLLAYGASEAAAKLSRLGVVIAVARTLDLAEIGLAAAALATGDLLKSLTENGVGQRIIAAPAASLEAVCQRAWRLNWLWCGGLFVAQSGLGVALWWATGQWELALLIIVLAGEYLFMPGGLVQCGLALRAGKLKHTAAIAGAQALSANLLSIVLALIWPSALALVLPRLLTAPLWLVAMRRLNPWQPKPAGPDTPLAPLAPFLRFGAPVLGVELVKTARLHADKLLVGALLGPQALGAYFMAFNAGLSLATSFSTAFASVLFPHLCQSADRARAMRDGLWVSLAMVGPLVILQSLLAPWYVPLLLGEAHRDLAGPVAVLCLVALPTMLWTAAAGWMRAENRAALELRGTAILTVSLLVSTWLAAPHGLLALAWAYLATACITMLLISRQALGASTHLLFRKEG